MMKPSTQDRTEGKLHEVKGQIKEEVGKGTNNPDFRSEKSRVSMETKQGENDETKYARPDRGQASRSKRADQRGGRKGDERPRLGGCGENREESWQSTKMDRPCRKSRWGITESWRDSSKRMAEHSANWLR